ncbi:hypothetical protein IC582_017185 [Cucumis melo]
MIFEELAEKISNLVEFQIFSGKEVPKAFCEMFKYCNLTALPISAGISPEKLLLLKSANVRFSSKPKP